MVQRGQKGEQRCSLIKPQYVKYRLAARARRWYVTQRRPMIFATPIFIVVYSLFSGQQLFWNRIA
jgi:hypothetical protein